MNPVAPESPVELIAEARRSLREVERMLLAPTARDIHFCRTALADATHKVERLRDLLAASGACDPSLRSPGMLESAARLRAQVASIGTLLDRAAAFHSGLLHSMMAAARSEIIPYSSLQETATRVQLDA